MAIATTRTTTKTVAGGYQEPLKLTPDMEATGLDIALDSLAKTLAGLLKNMDELQTNIHKLTDQNEKLKKAVIDLSDNPYEDLRKILNEK